MTAPPTAPLRAPLTAHAARLAALRTELAARGLDGFVVPLTDEHMSEYVGSYAQRLAWLTGFHGSAGHAAVLADRAAIFTDGRYTIQVRAQVDGDLFEYQDIPATSATDWLAAHAPAGARIGHDQWLHTRSWARTTAAALAARGAELVATETNPIDAIWQDQPAPSLAPVEVHADQFAGRSSADKRAALAATLRDRKIDCAVISALDSIAWALNIRGRDVDHTPVALAFALLHADASVDLFTAPEKITPAVRDHLGQGVRTHDRSAFAAHLATLTGKRVQVDPASGVAGIFNALEAGGAKIIEGRDPCVLPKAIKNPVEIAGTQAAHRRDGAALTRFLHWVKAQPPGAEDELSASDQLLSFRRETNMLEDLSFDTISGSGPNGAIVHYRSSPATNRPLEDGSLYLVDSGGQYRDGTTDVTRTLAIGTPSAEMQDRYTRVLKGHIALATAVFPAGTRGGQLDSLARAPLWAAGLDYAHGTGHGVGSYLAVHEGPQRIASSAAYAGSDEPLVAGMILSNEPGYYKTGAYGIRIENLVLIEEADVPGAEKPMLRFRELTLAPLDRDLIEPSLLSAHEIAWIDAYHARVRAELGDALPEETRGWFEAATAALG
ncbi:Xaa-Pro aminopeptidase [Polymorphobacter multimanifer]|uniref:Xaa-Pro aminopeptidase n=1 Tax=Polymorphobacter multimanifer TaxID=1070431 RepID=A0A841L3L8_9SPHN|nr:Xaa-Pro aminopeptidase [Polymorphobacter multimanifer]